MQIRRQAAFNAANERLRRERAERKRVEAALLAEQSLSRALFDAIPDQIYFKDLHSRFLRINLAQAVWFGLRAPEQAVGKTDFDFFTAEHARAAYTDEQKIISTGQPVVGLEEKETWPDGRETWVFTTKAPLHDHAGRLIGTFGISRDITARKQAEDQLLQLQKAVETMSLGVTITDLTGRISYANPAAARMHGYQAAELRGQDRGIFTLPELRPPVTLAEIMQGKGLSRETMDLRKDGSLFPAGVIAEVVRDAAGEPCALVISCEDLTAQKLAEAELAEYRAHLEELVEERTVELQQEIAEHERAARALRASEETLRSIFDSSPNAITQTDLQSVIVECNQMTLELHGYASKAEVIGQHAFALIAPADRAAAAANLQTTYAQGIIKQIEYTLLRKNGQTFPAELSASVVRDFAGQPIGFVAVTRDITAWKQAEAALQRAKAAAESANQAKSEFLANMSHELRTPLNAILGYAQILLRAESLPEEHREAVSIIQRSGEHLLAMITEILDFAKIEARRIALEPAEFHLPGLLQSLTDMIRIRAYRQGLRFTAELAPDLPVMTYGDEKRLRQILLNLLSNAVKFTEKGAVSLSVSAVNAQDFGSPTLSPPVNGAGLLSSTPSFPRERGRQSHSPRLRGEKGGWGVSPDTLETAPTFRFEVEDTGNGIPAEQLERIFLPFEQVGEPQLRSEGTGLGLAISQQLVRLMGSELRVRSTFGQGSVFWFDLHLPAVETSASRAGEPEPHRIIGFLGAKRRILIADDNEINRLMLKRLLAAVGFEIFEAADGQAAVAQAVAARPDLILMDLMMPVLDGFAATRQIRQSPALAAVVVIAVSANVTAQAQQESFAAGCQAFLAKPIAEASLLEKVRQALRLEWIYRAEPAAEPGQNGRPPAETPVRPPPRETLTQLHELALIGDIFEIRHRLDALERSAPEFHAFAASVGQLVKDLKISEIQRVLEHYLNDEI